MSLARLNAMSDVDALARIIDAEAGMEPLEGKLAVAAVIDNRRRAGGYGDGWKGVIAKPGQFSAINDVTGYAGGKGANRIFWRRPSPESLQVAQTVISGEYQDPTGGAVNYFNPDYANPKWAQGREWQRIGNHVFGSAGAGRDVQVADAGGLQKVTDPAILEQLNAPQEPQLQKVTDPALLEMLNAPEQQPEPQVDTTPPGLPQKGMIEGAFDEFTSGAVANFGDELTALENAIPALFNDDNFMEQYQINLSEERERSRAFAEENPVTATAANIGGSLAMAGGAAKQGVTLAGATKTVPGAIGAGAAEGSAYGLIWGAGAAEGDLEQVTDQALQSGAVGALLGGAITGLVQKIGNSAARSKAVQALRPTADMKAARDQAYQAVTDLGAEYAANKVDDLIDSLTQQVNSKAFNPELHRGTAAALQYAQSLKGKPITLTELDQLRQIVSRDAYGSAVPADKTFAGIMIDGIDDFVDRIAPRTSSPGGSRRAARAIRGARKAHAQFKKTELVDRLLFEAANQAGSTGSGGNINNAIRQKFKSVLNNKKQSKFFNSEELGAMRRIVRGSNSDNIMRLVGKLSPSGNGLMMALNIGAMANNPAFAAGTAIGAGAKALADRGTQRAVTGLQSVIQTGDDATRATQNLTAQKRALLRTLAAEFGMELSEPATPTTGRTPRGQ